MALVGEQEEERGEVVVVCGEELMRRDTRSYNANASITAD